MARPRRSLQHSLRQLRELCFHRYEACSEVVRAWFQLRKTIDSHHLSAQLWRVHDWIISPLTLQALDYTGLAKHIVSIMGDRREFDGDLNFLLMLIDQPPSSRVVSRMMLHEKAVEMGSYDGLSREPLRYQELELKIRADPELVKFWNRLKSRYARQFRPNLRGVIRRTLARERGFDSRKSFRWSKKRDRFQITFDALCYRWCLYGFERESPLALKLTANTTPHGTMIFVPRGMSLAANGTFVWRKITEIHKAHGANRQGERLFEIRLQNRSDRETALRHDATARRLKLRGTKRYHHILKLMGQPTNRVRWLKRLLYGC